MNNFYDIETACCDSCGFHGPVSVYRTGESTFVASCAVCDPKAWEILGEESKATWLSGGLPYLGVGSNNVQL